MSSSKKEKIRLFERLEITDPEYAQKLYEKESSKFLFKLICAGVSLTSSVAWILVLVFGNSSFISTLSGILIFIGLIATFVSAPIVTIKTMFKIVRFGWSIIPFILLDLFGAILGLGVALWLLGYAPIVYCAIGLYQSYINKKEAEAFLAAELTPERSVTGIE